MVRQTPLFSVIHLLAGEYPGITAAMPLLPENSTDRVEGDLFCKKCQYNLRTLAMSSRCPECGYPVCASLASELHNQRKPGTGVEIAFYLFFFASCAIPGFLTDVFRPPALFYVEFAACGLMAVLAYWFSRQDARFHAISVVLSVMYVIFSFLFLGRGLRVMIDWIIS